MSGRASARSRFPAASSSCAGFVLSGRDQRAEDLLARGEHDRGAGAGQLRPRRRCWRRCGSPPSTARTSRRRSSARAACPTRRPPGSPKIERFHVPLAASQVQVTANDGSPRKPTRTDVRRVHRRPPRPCAAVREQGRRRHRLAALAVHEVDVRVEVERRVAGVVAEHQRPGARLVEAHHRRGVDRRRSRTARRPSTRRSRRSATRGSGRSCAPSAPGRPGRDRAS